MAVEHIDFQTLLATAAAERISFGTQMILADDDQVPPDVRYRFVTKDDFDDLTAATVFREYSTVFFQPDVKADKLMLGRWISAASNPYWVAGPAYEPDFEVWEVISDGAYKVVDSSLNEVDVTGNDFTGITALDQILAIMNAVLGALVTPAVVGLDDATWEFDALGRLRLNMATTGSTAPTISVTTPASGTDLSALMDKTNGIIQAGIDIETQTAAVQAISALEGGDVWYHLNERGGDDTNREELAAYIETQEKLCVFVLTAAAVKNPGSTTDLAYKLEALGYKRTLGIYTEAGDYPDAAAAGKWIPFLDGTAVVPQYEWQELVGVLPSGSPNPLTPGDKLALEAKKVSRIESSRGITYLYAGLTFGNVEMRVMFGRDWFNEQNRAALFTGQITRPLSAFDNATLAALEGDIRDNIELGQDRKLISTLPSQPATVTLPDADDIDAATRASHTLTDLEAFSCFIVSAIHDYKIVGLWQ
jgi:hypothetical protein